MPSETIRAGFYLGESAEEENFQPGINISM